jgi:hypothetical protein
MDDLCARAGLALSGRPGCGRAAAVRPEYRRGPLRWRERLEFGELFPQLGRMPGAASRAERVPGSQSRLFPGKLGQPQGYGGGPTGLPGLDLSLAGRAAE